MAIDVVAVTVWIVVDEDGDYSVSREGSQEAGEVYEEEYRPLAEAAAVRRVQVTIQVPRPRAAEITATLSAESDAGSVSVQ